MIPKIIHYCWFGLGELSPIEEKCLLSWKEFCPEWEIRRWDESNSPMTTKWVKQAYRHQKYAFVSDYVRFWALYHFGGIYLDTDMMLFRSLDVLINYAPFIGRIDEKEVGLGIIGAESGDAFCEHWMRYYESAKFDVVSAPPNANIDTWIGGFSIHHTERGLDYLSNGLMLYPYDWFMPIHYRDKMSIDFDHLSQYATENTIAMHLWLGSWLNEFYYLDRGDYLRGFKMVRARLATTFFLPLKYYKKLLKYTFRYLADKSQISRNNHVLG